MRALKVERLTCARIPTAQGRFELCLYTSNQDDKDHLALVMGEVSGQQNVLIRMHSECIAGDLLGSQLCDCGPKIREAMRVISLERRGVLIYLRQERRGMGPQDKLRAPNLQDDGYGTVEANWLLGHVADEHDYRVAAKILEDLGPSSVRLLTNNPEKLNSLRELGIAVSDRIPLETEITVENADHLRAKAIRLNQFLAAGRDGPPI